MKLNNNDEESPKASYLDKSIKSWTHLDNELQKHLMEIDKTAHERFELLMKQFAEKENITEELKATNQMLWVQKMNYIKNSVEEIILNELIYT